jgi:hypothetical protein
VERTAVLSLLAPSAFPSTFVVEVVPANDEDVVTDGKIPHCGEDCSEFVSASVVAPSGIVALASSGGIEAFTRGTEGTPETIGTSG